MKIVLVTALGHLTGLIRMILIVKREKKVADYVVMPVDNNPIDKSIKY